MYDRHFGLTQPAFRETADPGAFLPLPERMAALRRLRYGLENGPGMAAVLGISGVGKTILARTLAREMDAPAVQLGYANLPPHDLVAWIAGELAASLGATAPSSTAEPGHALIRARLALHAPNRPIGRPLVLIDEAHLIDDPRSFEVLRALTNLGGSSAAGPAVVLIGGPELADRMPLSIVDRLGAEVTLLPLTATDSASYIIGQLAVAGAVRPIFEADALGALHHLSMGIPRRLNRLADMALLIAASRGLPTVPAELVRAAADEAGYLRAA